MVFDNERGTKLSRKEEKRTGGIRVVARLLGGKKTVSFPRGNTAAVLAKTVRTFVVKRKTTVRVVDRVFLDRP